MLSAVEPTAAEQYMLELINRARANPAGEAALDGIDLNEGLPAGTIAPGARQPLAFNPMLITAARAHTTWMLGNGVFAHNEGNADPFAQMQSAGYAFSGSYGWGQNIAWRGSAPDAPPLDPTVAAEHQDLFVDSTEPGRGHRLNILDANFKEIGIGIAQGTFQGYNAVMTSEDFADESGSSFLTGVAYADANSNHSYNPGEGLGGITITATRASDQATFSTTTWAAGGYSLALDPGTYTIVASGAGLGTVTQSNVTIGSQNVEADFTPGMASTPSPNGNGSGGGGSGGGTPVTPTPTPTPMPTIKGWVTGSIFKDINGNGIDDAGEPGLGRWRVFVDLNDDGIWQHREPSVLTNARGQFVLRLAPGTYRLRAVLKQGFNETTVNYIDVTVAAGETSSGVQFGALPRPKRRAVHAQPTPPITSMATTTLAGILPPGMSMPA